CCIDRLNPQALSRHSSSSEADFGLSVHPLDCEVEFQQPREEKDGDGPWSQKFTPPADMNGSLAGYIWGCLAAPRASLRWEAAHVVRALCVLGHQRTLGHLVALASGTPASAFHYSRLHFYELHARLWLLIGFVSRCKESPRYRCAAC
ncbi:hypothetical protein, partial [Variovorax sp. MHTC-1]|uniref:hypothetical protein n=1 Tax=Variovorax sp. MHTC-1 TaxID=2495593 RepID=UPI001C8E5D61